VLAERTALPQGLSTARLPYSRTYATAGGRMTGGPQRGPIASAKATSKSASPTLALWVLWRVVM
jgi:hypothetical protein